MVHPSSLRIPRVRRYSGYCSLFFRFRLSGSHTLRRAFPCASANSKMLIAVRTPAILLPPVWPFPRSLATTCGISFDFSSSGYLDVSVHPVSSSHAMCSHAGTRTLLQVSSLIRKSAGQSLFAAHRSLSQLVTSFVGSQCQGILRMLFYA